jgi:hypothetical protein
MVRDAKEVRKVRKVKRVAVTKKPPTPKGIGGFYVKFLRT